MAGEGKTGFLGWVTLAVALLTCGSVMYALAQTPKTVSSRELLDRRLELDPAIGRKVDLGNHKGKRVVVAMGDCASCSIHNSNFEDLRVLGEANIVGVYKAGADVSNVTGKSDWIALALDDAELHSRLNAFFFPRCYAFDASGALVAVQKPDETLKDFASRIGGMK